jgi:exonuclease SbcD
MKILHTSDWHIGKMLYTRKRYKEFEEFLLWLVEAIKVNNVDVLIVAGDIFDNGTPSNRAQELYYRFLAQVSSSSCRHIVVVAGNHDSPSFLSAPESLLKALDVHVISQTNETLDDQVLVLRDSHNVPEVIVCAVPYLRDRDLRLVEAGESMEDRERKLVEGIRTHYAAVSEIAEQKRKQYECNIPIVGTGHLFTAGGQTIDGDGVRELYIGSLAHVTSAIFPSNLSYVALGHLHVPQKVNGSEIIRYSGSPIPMGFGEATQQKSVCVVEFENTNASIELINVPTFQRLERITGDWETISARIRALAAEQAQTWLEVIYNSDEVMSDLREKVATLVAETQLEVLRVKNTQIVDRTLGQIHDQEMIADLTPEDVFARCLAANGVGDAQQPELMHTYQEALQSLHDSNQNAD